MTVHIKRDATGDVARLECDRRGCGRLSAIWLKGQPRIVELDAIRCWLRARCHCAGWISRPRIELGQCIIVDLCPRCASHRKEKTWH